jgi:hypothetical protein
MAGCVVRFADRVVGELAMEFLHHGLAAAAMHAEHREHRAAAIAEQAGDELSNRRCRA